MILHFDIIHLVCEYIPQYVLLDWIKINQIDISRLSSNPNSGDLFLKYINIPFRNAPEKDCLLRKLLIENLNWAEIVCRSKNVDLIKICKNPYYIDLCRNKYAIDIINDNFYNHASNVSYDASRLVSNPNAIDIVKEHIEFIRVNDLSGCHDYEIMDYIKHRIASIDWDVLSANPYAIDILKNNLNRINWFNLSGNINAIDILKVNKDKIDWFTLSSNPNAIELLQNNQDKINWYNLFKNPNAIPIIKQNMHRIDKELWEALSRNPNAIDILKNNQNHINWYYISTNPGIFKPMINVNLKQILLKVL